MERLCTKKTFLLGLCIVLFAIVLGLGTASNTRQWEILASTGRGVASVQAASLQTVPLVVDRTPAFIKPLDGFYPITSFVDHGITTWCDRDGQLRRLDGRDFATSSPLPGQRGGTCVPDCTLGDSCYDGHDGVDYGGVRNAEVRAVLGGTIVVADNKGDKCRNPLTRVHINHPNGFQTRYLHLSRIENNPRVNPPAAVAAG